MQTGINMLLRCTLFLAHTSLALAQCPAVWTSVSTTLQSAFAGCNDDARAAFRASFHDCINGACDGSLVLAGECSRTENAGLESYCAKVSAWAAQFSIGTADLIQFAQAVALAVCPGGPRIRVLVGRKDNSKPALEGIIPRSNDTVSDILSTFAAVGMSTTDVVALVGAHSTAKQFFDDPAKAGTSLDSTPAEWDIKFYEQTLFGTAPYTLASDRKMSQDLRTAPQWIIFSVDKGAWATAFTNAMDRFIVVGNDANTLTDCSEVVPRAAKTRRDAKKAPLGWRTLGPKLVSQYDQKD